MECPVNTKSGTFLFRFRALLYLQTVYFNCVIFFAQFETFEVEVMDAPDSVFYYPAGYWICRIVEKIWPG